MKISRHHSLSFVTGFILFFLSICVFLAVPVHAEEDPTTINQRYHEYRQRFDGIETNADISANGFSIIEDHAFLISLRYYGEVTFVPAIHRQYHRLAIFLVREDGRIVYKTDQLETNNQNPGELKQPNKGIAAVSFQDVNKDHMIDIQLITFCERETGAYVGKTYKVGDVLFQNNSPDAMKGDLPFKQAFYRDYRISAKLNQYGMNKSIGFINAFLVGGYSTEFLYTATTREELLRQGFQSIDHQSYLSDFEKWGRLQVVPGFYKMAEYHVFMVYLINEQGYIVWSFQPMRDYESLYSVQGITCQDIDGDGLKDIVVLGRYIFEETDNESVIESDYSIYYQRTGGFYMDEDFKSTYQCTDSDNLEDIVKKAHTYWGWN